MSTELTGGCQCGAIRFRLEGQPKEASICHCRMCQKAFGNFYAPFAAVEPQKFQFTRGSPRYFRSSNHVKRGFCENCGTPLSYEAPDGIGVAIGAFDNPSLVAPTVQFGVEGKIAYVDHLHELPSLLTQDDVSNAPFLADIQSYQHPDHDTETWVAQRADEPDHWRPREEGV